MIGLEATYDTDGLSWSSLVSGSATGLSRSYIVVEMSNDYAIINGTGTFKYIWQVSSLRPRLELATAALGSSWLLPPAASGRCARQPPANLDGRTRATPTTCPAPG